MNTCKVSAGLNQYTAIDDCRRYEVLAPYPRRNAVSTLEYLERVVDEMPYPVQRSRQTEGETPSR
jgi:hypothetical protein